MRAALAAGIAAAALAAAAAAAAPSSFVPQPRARVWRGAGGKAARARAGLKPRAAAKAGRALQGFSGQ